MKTKHSTLSLAILSAHHSQPELGFASLSLKKSEDGWCHLLPAGHFKAVDGRPFDVEGGHWFLDEATANELIAQLKARNTPVVIDYEHQTLAAAENGKEAPASGRFQDARWQEDGLWIKPAWTKRASNYIDDDEYSYLSAVFPYDKKTGKPVSLHSAALTNTPGLDNLNKVSLSAKYFSTTHLTQTTPEETIMDLKQLIMLLGLSESATEADVKAAIEKLKKHNDDAKTEVATLTASLSAAKAANTNDVDPAKYVPISVVTDMQAQLAALSAEVKTGGLDKLIEDAKADGRLLPAMEDWAKDLGKKDMAALTTFLDAATPIAALNQQQAGKETPPSTNNSHGLTDDELEVAALTGRTPEEFAALKAKT